MRCRAQRASCTTCSRVSRASCLTYSRSLRSSCPTYFSVLCALCPTCSRVSRASCLTYFCAIPALLLDVPRSLRVLVFSCLTCLVSHLLRALRAHVSLMSQYSCALRFLLLLVSRTVRPLLFQAYHTHMHVMSHSFHVFFHYLHYLSSELKYNFKIYIQG